MPSPGFQFAFRTPPASAATMASWPTLLQTISGIAVVLHRVLQIEERDNLNQTAHGEDERDNDEQGPDIPLQAVLKALGWCVFSHVSYLG
jgi:hypothetical protein